MGDDTVGPVRSAMNDLAHLSEHGVTTDSVVRCQALAQLIFGEALPLLEQLPPRRRERTVQAIIDLLSHTANAARNQAYELLDWATQPQESRACRTAAVAELMMPMDTALFDEARKRGKWENDENWNARLNIKEYRGRNSARRRQLRAAIWLGGLSDKAIRDNRSELIEAFVSTLEDYLTEEVRRELKNVSIDNPTLQKSPASSANGGAPISNYTAEGTRGLDQVPYSVPMLYTVRRALDAAHKSCQVANRRFVTPNLLLTLLEIPDGRAAACFDAVRPRLASWARVQLAQYLASTEVGHFVPFSWEERADILLAQEIASITSSCMLTELHILAAILDTQSTTSRQLADELGAGFPRLRDQVWHSIREVPPFATPGPVWKRSR